MPPTVRIPVAIFATMFAAVAACKQSDAGAASASSGATTKPAAATPASTDANTSASSGKLPNDTISERADRGRILGDSTASLWVIMASDFQCPYCKQWHDTQFQKVLNSYVNTKKVRLAFLNMPLSIHPNAVPAAEAAMCASVQNKFWQMHEALFATQKQWENLPKPDSAFADLAKRQGVEMNAWNTCVSKHLTIALIQADHDRATSARVNSTPTFFIGNQVLPGADVDVAAAIDAALKQAAMSKPQGD